MKKGVIISGFGGQGVMLAGNLLCESCMEQGYQVTFFPSYGAEMRGGTANCQVVISDNPVGAPVVTTPDVLLAFNNPSFKRFAPKVRENGIIFVNSSLFIPEDRASYSIDEVPASSLAEECGSHLVMNVVMLGYAAARTGITDSAHLKKASRKTFTGKKEKFLDINIKAIELGFSKAAS